MVKRTIIFCLILLAMTTCVKWHPIRMVRVSYTGKELRMDGYYYTNATFNDNSNSCSRELIIFYRNGFCVESYSKMKDSTDFSTMEKDLIKSVEYATNREYNKLFFHIQGQSIEIEGYMTGTIFERDTYCLYGKILNDTTFVINKYFDNFYDEESEKNLTYHFKYYMPKPDSTCVYMN